MITQAAKQYQFLSVSDLLDAREAFHVHLMKKENVVGTAIGKYRRRLKKNDEAKRLDNTRVDELSWPCLLVFVKKWMTTTEFKASVGFDSYIPSSVCLPDGREIPICVIEAPSSDASADMVVEQSSVFPSDYIGGGYPLLIQSQGVERMASIGCVVSDGHKYYAVTNRHVTGTPGTIVYTKVKGTLVPIGKSTDRHIGNVAFEKLYTGWRASNMVTNVDVGLIEIDDIRYWKTDVFGIGTLGKVLDLSTNNLSLNIIGCPVKAYGGASGRLNGEVSALFYRYKSVGGIEYVSDFMIGSANQAPLDTKHGDSGTVWVVETKDDAGQTVNQPLAIQWGQHCFQNNGKTLKHTFALATCLSNVLRELSVDIVSGWNDDTGYTWGEVGHYTIANIAVDMVTNRDLHALLSDNLELITFKQNDLITDTTINKQRKLLTFTPLADVPDLIWKLRGGKYQRSLENPNHFADMDKLNSDGKTLLDLCKGKGENMKFLSPEEWLSYYSDKAVKDSSKGILPFRVWQIFAAMVDCRQG